MNSCESRMYPSTRRLTVWAWVNALSEVYTLIVPTTLANVQEKLHNVALSACTDKRISGQAWHDRGVRRNQESLLQIPQDVYTMQGNFIVCSNDFLICTTGFMFYQTHITTKREISYVAWTPHRSLSSTVWSQSAEVVTKKQSVYAVKYD